MLRFLFVEWEREKDRKGLLECAHEYLSSVGNIGETGGERERERRRYAGENKEMNGRRKLGAPVLRSLASFFFAASRGGQPE